MADQSPVKCKSSWENLVGKTYDEAAKVIKGENPELEVVKVCPGQPVTRDYRFNRVRIFVDDKGKVSETPKTG
ncbi:uncharacterized protein LOC143284308 [Babylonia areolata]|uniref:uncharacterized protein LOC143284308 n=1 Tax=Babylonia areolata TaxID=304850 RepID=UPI003FD4696D